MKRYITLILSLTILLSSCNLDLVSESELTYNGYWKTEEAVQAAHTGLADRYRAYANTLFKMGEMRSDIWGGQVLEGPWDVELIRNNISNTQVFFGNWSGFYGLIHYLNDFIVNAPSVPFKDEGKKNQMLAQTYGIRAQVYYTMLRAWGDVPITLEPLKEVNLILLKKQRSPKEEVMKQVKSDIEESLKLFGETNTKWLGKNIYWSKAATLALKGDVYLWSGKVLGGGNEDFIEAKKALESITGYELVPYENLWGEDNEDNNEFIFAFDYKQDEASNFYSAFTGRVVDLTSYYDEKGETLKSSSLLGNDINVVLSGGSRYSPSPKVLKLLDDPNDKRKDTFIRVYDDAAGHSTYVDDDPHYKTSVLKKFLGKIYADGQRKNFNNIPLYRYADVLLMLAEAKNNLGEDPSDEMNQVRRRAYGDHFEENKFVSGTQAENRISILQERLKEFIGEGKRWWDLVRAGDGIVYQEVTSLSANESYKLYYSISESMIANDSELKQTEGYTTN